MPRRSPAPALPHLHLDGLADGDAADLVPGADLDGVRVRGAHAGGAGEDTLSLVGAVLRECDLDRLVAAELDLGGARLLDVRLAGVEVPVVRAARGQWRDVEVTGRLGSVEAYDADWRAVHLVGCKLGYLNLRGAQVRDLVLTDCRVGELDLGGAHVVRARLDHTGVDRLGVRGAELEHVDLRGARLEEVDGPRDLHGAVVTRRQLAELAPLLAAEVGLEVRD